MDWLEQNLDAYRIIAEILNDLREILRRRLEHLSGPDWYKSGLPDGLLAQLVERKEQEKAIDWYESEYQQIMNYALFPELLAILEHNSQALPQILKLAPTQSLLQARFLELEVMRAKLGRARPISETELSFLGTFHLRFRKAIEEHRLQATSETSASRTASPAVPAEPARPAPPTPQPPVQPPERPPEQPPVQPPERPPEQPPVQPPPEVAADVEPEPTPPPQAASAAEDPQPGSVTQQPVQPPEPAVEEPAEEAPLASPTEAEPAPAVVQDTAATVEKELTLDEALEGDQHQAVLRQLYREVTTIAEGIWIKDIPPPARVWEQVSVSTWYEQNFSPLGLRPLSDFYDVISKVDQKMRAGTSREELQQYLKECNFAQILLSLRDMFQRNQI